MVKLNSKKIRVIMVNPLISVIIPIFKTEKYIYTCVNSVLQQHYGNFELILVNDGSPDNCPQICDNYAKNDDRIIVVHKENGGLSSARNSGLEIFTGEFVTFLDSDDFWHPNYLKVMVNMCLINKADISQCSFVRGTASIFPPLKFTNSVKVFNNKEVFTKNSSNIILCAKMFKRQIFDEIRMPIGKINEDDFTTWKCYFASNKIAITDDPYYYYTFNEQSIMSAAKTNPRLDFMEAYDERISFFRDNDEKAMEDFSRIHYCKALLLTSANKMLANEQKKLVRNTFLENYKVIKYSKIARPSFLILFAMFRFFPQTTLLLLNMVR